MSHAQATQSDQAYSRYFKASEIILVFGASNRRHLQCLPQIEEQIEVIKEKSGVPISLSSPTEDEPVLEEPVIFQDGSKAKAFVRVQLKQQADMKDKDKDQGVVDAVNRLNNDVNEHLYSQDELELVAAAPNWLFSGAGHSLTHVSPGGHPVPANAPTNGNKPYERLVENTNSLFQPASNPSIQATQSGDSCPVNVVIFDTMPSLKTFNDFERRSGNSKPPLLSNLMYKLQRHYAMNLGIQLPKSSIPQQPEEGDYYQKDLYDMSDHGLFIAGMIHALAPQANIHLVQVLNDYGVADSMSLARGIQALIDGKIVNRQENAPLIVNCSLCIDFETTLENQGSIDLPSLTSLWNPAQCKKHIALMFCRLQTAFTPIRIVAAAGNDGDKQSATPPPARYPAAFREVIGVGALEDDRGTRAWYSNRADRPPSDGLLIFGGKIKENAGKNETVPGEGVLGLYIGKFPDGSQSTNGWAYWSGTSFAAPFVSGLLAKAAGQCLNIDGTASDNFFNTLKAAAAQSSGSQHILMRRDQTSPA